MENESKVGNLFLDFLVKQNYKKVWFLIKKLRTLKVEYFFNGVMTSPYAFFAYYAFNFFIADSSISVWLFSDSFNVISVRSIKIANKGVIIRYQSTIDMKMR